VNDPTLSNSSSPPFPPRVCAVVVTFRRPQLLRECLHALGSQTRPVDHVLVIDNASDDGTPDAVRGEFPGVEVVELRENGGGAGGFHEGMKRAYDAGYDWFWLMDDDGRPAPDCLEQLLAPSHPLSAMVPLQQNSDGKQYGFFRWRGRGVDVTAQVVEGGKPVKGDYAFAFVGPLISRAVAQKVGFPRADFFIWFDDWEYALRVRHRSRADVILVPDALFFHDFGGKEREFSFLGRRTLRSEQPPWKTYYEARNQLWTMTRSRRRPRELPVYARTHFNALAGDLLFSPDRWERARLRLRGVLDGVLGRMGKRVSPSSPKGRPS